MNLAFERAIDLKIIRGLDYYTGTIFEANFKSDE
jgi:histidyl-tRNA synthetase